MNDLSRRYTGRVTVSFAINAYPLEKGLTERRLVNILLTLVVFALILAVLRDILQELFSPNGYGRLSRRVQVSLWHAAKRYARGDRRKLALTGPIGVIVIIDAERPRAVSALRKEP